MYSLMKYNKHTYNAYVISVIKPVSDLHTPANSIQNEINTINNEQIKKNPVSSFLHKILP